MYKSSDYRKTRLLTVINRVAYILVNLYVFTRVGLFVCFILISGRRGYTPHVGSNRDECDDVDAVDMRSTRSTINARA